VFQSPYRLGAQKQRKVQSISVPSPTGGVNARDAIANMAPTDCIVGDNWFGNPSYLAIRNGSSTWSTGLPGAVETVMAYNGLTSRKLFAASVTSIYDITSTGAVGAASVTGIGNARLQHAMFNAGGGNVLIWVNGAVTGQFYNGAVWAPLVITGVTAANLITITVFKQRCFYIEKKHDVGVVLSNLGVPRRPHADPARAAVQERRDAGADGHVDHRQRVGHG
jgi:hypothetical protein